MNFLSGNFKNCELVVAHRYVYYTYRGNNNPPRSTFNITSILPISARHSSTLCLIVFQFCLLPKLLLFDSEGDDADDEDGNVGDEDDDVDDDDDDDKDDEDDEEDEGPLVCLPFRRLARCLCVQLTQADNGDHDHDHDNVAVEEGDDDDEVVVVDDDDGDGDNDVGKPVMT